MDLTRYIRDIPDFPKPGIQFKDITPLLSNPEAFRASIQQMAAQLAGKQVDALAAAEARGFLLAAPLAYVLQKPLVPLRKPGKLPYQTHNLKYDLEYGQAELQMHTDGVTAGSRVVVVDDVLATGGTMEAACKLIEQAGGEVVCCAVLLELTFLPGRDKLRSYEVCSLIRY